MNKAQNLSNPIHKSFDIAAVTTYRSGVLQARAWRTIKRLTDDWLREYGITTAQWVVIGMVHDSGKQGIRITDLAKQTDTTLSFLTHTVNLLESKSILTRVEHASDSRAKMVRMADHYTKTCKQIEAELSEKLAATLYSKVSKADLHTYVKVLFAFSDLTKD
ncbi:MAG: MarR family transcriptional regulator [Candidatus Saccharimonadales bacterium]